jgi:ABC-type Mn2+/Zn2+ transport system ATPase subunit
MCRRAEEVDWNFPVLVEDVVMMGRYGHMGWMRRAGLSTATKSLRRWRASA